MSDLIKYDPDQNLPPELASQFAEDAKANLEGVQARVPRVKMPTGRGKIFAVENFGEGDFETNEIVGIIIYQTPANAWWEAKFGSGGASVIPDCASHDGIKPSPEYPKLQSKDCASCPRNKFGSAVDDSGNKMPGKACRNVKRLVILRADDPTIPVMLTVPPSSIKAFDDYMIRLRKEQRPYWSVATSLTLDTQRSKTNIEFPHLNFNPKGYVNDKDTLLRIKNMRTEWMEILQSFLFSKDETAADADNNFSTPTTEGEGPRVGEDGVPF